MDSLPTDLLLIIATTDEHTYRAMIDSLPFFARLLTPELINEVKSRLGFVVRRDVKILSICRYGPARTYVVAFDCEMICTRHGLLHRLDGPALVASDKYYFECSWFVNGKLDARDGKISHVSTSTGIEVYKVGHKLLHSNRNNIFSALPAEWGSVDLYEKYSDKLTGSEPANLVVEYIEDTAAAHAQMSKVSYTVYKVTGDISACEVIGVIE